MIFQDRWSFGIIWNMPQNVLSRPSQGSARGLGGRLTRSGSKFAPLAALVKALTSGILPAYLTMAGEHLKFASLWNANNLLVSWNPKWNWIRIGPFLIPIPQPCQPLTLRMMWHGWGESLFRQVQAKPLKSKFFERPVTVNSEPFAFGPSYPAWQKGRRVQLKSCRYWVAVAAVSLLELFLPSRLSRFSLFVFSWIEFYSWDKNFQTGSSPSHVVPSSWFNWRNKDCLCPCQYFDIPFFRALYIIGEIWPSS